MTEEKSELTRQAVRSIWDRVATADWARFEKENPERAAAIVIARIAAKEMLAYSKRQSSKTSELVASRDHAYPVITHRN